MMNGNKTNSTMQAVIFEGPGKMVVRRRPIPKVVDEDDVVVKVTIAGLCGSDLHFYRGHEKLDDTGFVMGHEFCGNIVEIGTNVKQFSIGDRVVCPFTTSCGVCFYCKNGLSSRCTKCLVFGTPLLDGAQAEFVRVPYADSTLIKPPPNLDQNASLLMADIFPTGYYGVRHGFAGFVGQSVNDAVVVIIGCGPVGLCAVVAALDRKPKKVFAIDSISSRLSIASSLGAEALNIEQGLDATLAQIKAATDNRGADVVIEVVGQEAALSTAYALIRPFGSISSLGAHHGKLPFTATDGYNKNIRLAMGRCPIRSIFDDALEVLLKTQHLFGFMFENPMSISEAAEAYEQFNKMQKQKIVFVP